MAMVDEAGLCDCGSGVAYAECCRPFVKEWEMAPTAEALMRSRYTAYAREEVDYLVNSQAPETRKPSLEREVLRFAQAADFEGLSIEHTEGGQPGDASGVVEFTARYLVEGKRHVMRERSNFRFDAEAGRWLYVSGSSTPATRAGEPKVGRNDPCPCGSGKKYKKCCGA
jgi:SEC-C motif-containing protein